MRSLPFGANTIFVPPILQCLIFGYAATYDLNDVPYAVLDQDRSAASRDFLARLDGSGVFHRVFDGFSSGYGFDAIAVALLGKNSPIGIVLAALNLRPAITSLGSLLEEVRDGLGMSAGVGWLSSMNSQIAVDSKMDLPFSSTSTGVMRKGLSFANAGSTRSS